MATILQACMGALVALTLGFVGSQSLDMLRINGLTTLKVVIFVLFLVLLFPIAMAFWTAAVGFLAHLFRSSEFVLRPPSKRTLDDSSLPRVALVMPAYNEDPLRMFAGLRATYASLEQTGLISCFDFFLLSDTTDPDIWVREEVAFAEWRSAVSDPERLHYRNRRHNVERKSGNIADFCAAWGDQYRYMVVLDADSIMTGDSLVSLVRLMESNPRVGILQAPPWPVNRRSLFGRLFQFATHAYSPLFIAGLNAWQGRSGNYWGHNAVIRVRPFVEHCRLPHLPGREPLGGSILSHDFVEAAFMRRAGWGVYLVGDLQGSYEEMPSSLIAYAARDRRWCQGNLQHIRLLLTPGLHYINRLHMGMGVMSYLASPLWVLLLLLSTAEGLRENLGKHPYFPPGPALFPTWTISTAQQSVLLFCEVMGLLLAPRVFCLAFNLWRKKRSAPYGGRLRLVLSVALETLFSTLIAPILAFLHTRFIYDILRGRKTPWAGQQRTDSETAFGEAWGRHWAASVVGIIWLAALAYAAPNLLWWFSPVLAGLILSVPVSAWSSRVGAGQWARAQGLFLISPEVNPPEILHRLEGELQEARGRPWAGDRDGLAWVLQEPGVAETHLSLLRPPETPIDDLQKHHLEGLRLKLRHGGFQALTPQEKRELLLDGESLRAMAGAPGLDRAA
jgi:membrane glycosyltransferase